MNVQFDEDNFGQVQRPGMPQATRSAPEESKLAGWMVKVGLAKDSSSANVIMTIGALCIFAISIYFFVFGFSKPVVSGPERAPSVRTTN